MKRVLVGASILAAFMTTATGMAVADTQPGNRISGAEIAGATGSSQELEVLLWQLGLGSSNPWCESPSFCMVPSDVNAPVADASAGSSDVIGNLLHALSTGSAAECDGVMLDVCVPIPAQPASTQQALAQPIADSGSALMTPETVLAINHALGWLYNGSSEPCVSLGPNCAWE